MALFLLVFSVIVYFLFFVFTLKVFAFAVNLGVVFVIFEVPEELSDEDSEPLELPEELSDEDCEVPDKTPSNMQLLILQVAPS